MLSRDQMEATLRRLNDAENRRPHSTVEAVLDGIDAVHTVDSEAWVNGNHWANRTAARDEERGLYELLTDYHRRFDRVIIDPPYASVAWTITGTAQGVHLEVQGCSNIEFDDDALIRRSWVYLDPTSFGVRRPG
jgi:16S rRNA G966 N2-methylase RsmD